MVWTKLLRGCIGGGTDIQSQAKCDSTVSIQSSTSDAGTTADISSTPSSSFAEATLTLRLVSMRAGQLLSTTATIDLPEQGLSASVWSQSGDTWSEAPSCAEAQAILAQMSAQDPELHQVLGQQAMEGQQQQTGPGRVAWSTYRPSQCTRGACSRVLTAEGLCERPFSRYIVAFRLLTFPPMHSQAS
jgi:hypothetical protein